MTQKCCGTCHHFTTKKPLNGVLDFQGQCRLIQSQHPTIDWSKRPLYQSYGKRCSTYEVDRTRDPEITVQDEQTVKWLENNSTF